MQQEATHKKMMMNRDAKQENTAAFVVSHHARATPSSGERPTCKHCGKYGHDETGCFELIGYPTDWARGGRSSHGRGRGVRGYRRQGTGRGRDAGAGKETAHAVQPIEAVADDVRGGGVAFTAEQVQKLLSLIETPKSSHERLSGMDV